MRFLSKLVTPKFKTNRYRYRYAAIEVCLTEPGFLSGARLTVLLVIYRDKFNMRCVFGQTLRAVQTLSAWLALDSFIFKRKISLCSHDPSFYMLKLDLDSDRL